MIMNTPASSKRNLVPYSVDLDNTPIDQVGNIGSSLMGKEEQLMESGLAETYEKMAELRLIEVMLMMKTKVHYCVVAEMSK